MWTPEHRRAANRSGLRYPSDLTDDEWAVIAPNCLNYCPGYRTVRAVAVVELAVGPPQYARPRTAAPAIVATKTIRERA
jgi:hypothetical protein